MIGRAGVLGLLLAASPAIAAAPPDQPDLLYTIKRGDTLEGLAIRGLKRRSDWRVVERHNRIRQVRALRTGSTLRIPAAVLRTTPIGAKVIAFRGSSEVGGKAAAVGMAIIEGQMLQTGANAFLAVELADGSLLTLPSRSRMVVAGLHRITLTGGQVKSFRLLAGRAETEVQPVDTKGGRFEIRTPVSVAAVRGTKFRATFEETGSAAGTGVIEGAVRVRAGSGSVAVPQGKGVVATETGPGAPVDLLPKPTLNDPDNLQDEEEVGFALSPVAGASAYRIQLATDAGFIEVFAEADSKSPQIVFGTVPNGSFFARATALSADGLEGLPAAYSFERRQNNVKVDLGEPDRCPAARCLRFRWRAGGEGERRFRFQLLPGRDAPPLIDVPEMTGTEITITDLPGGTYYWRVESTLLEGGKRQSKWMDLQELRVSPAATN